MKAPVVSVVMPVYNRERYVGAAIESILAQSVTTYPYLAVVTKNTSFEGLRSIKKGMQWQPFLG